MLASSLELSPRPSRRQLSSSGPLSTERSCSNKTLYRYQIEKEDFASGCFGKIILARDANNKEVVIKKLPKDKVSSTEVLKEIEAGKILKHPNISKFIENFSNNENDYLVFERIQGMDLFSTIEKRAFVPFKDSEARKIFKQILKAVMYSHEKGIVHRDIKLENILMDSNFKVTVLDYGLCDVVKKGQRSERFCGSMDYVAPEVISTRSYDGFQADCFSLGVVLYTLLFAEFPFVANERVNAAKNNLPHPNIIWNETKLKRYKISDIARDLIIKMLRTDPLNRITLEQVKQHPWMKKSKLLSAFSSSK